MDWPKPKAVPVEMPITVIEYPFYVLGLTTPLKRLLFGMAFTDAVLFATKPAWAFNEDGSARPWSIVSAADSTNSTNVPWWLPGVVTGIILSTFV